jgi:hypothetical protein
MNFLLNSNEIVRKKSLKIEKYASDVSQILSYLNEILTFVCYHICWQLGRVLESVGHSLSNALIGVRSKSDRVVEK